MDPVDEAIAQQAFGQGGHISHRQLRELGLSRRAIQHRIARGLLIPVYHGVYAVGRLPNNPIDRAHGAILACGPRAAISHTSAGSFWRVHKKWSYPLHVSTSLDRRPDGVITHHRPSLLRADIHTDPESGLRVTSPALTVLDNAKALGEKRVQRAVNELRLGRLLAIEDLQELLTRYPRHPGRRLTERVIGGAQPEPTRSGLEDTWPPFAETYGLTGWAMNQWVAGHRVDVLFLPDLLVVELDGPITHDMPLQAEADKEQDADIVDRAGIPTVRITDDQFKQEPARQAARIHRILATRQARAA